MSWEAEQTAQFVEWYGSLTEDEQDRVIAAVELLEESGPTLGRPLVDTLTGSRHPNMKELRPRPGNLRILFAFDTRRTAILLVGGDKTGQWEKWYRRMIPVADELFDQHLERLKKRGKRDTK